MDSNNINRPDNTNTPDIPTKKTPPDSIPSQDTSSCGHSSENPGGTQRQNTTPYGNPNETQTQNINPYGASNGSPNPNTNFYGTPNGSPDPNRNPYGTPNGSPDPNRNPYGTPNGSPDPNRNPYGTPSGIPNQNGNSYGSLNGSPNQNLNSYGSPNGLPDPNSNPYRNPNHPQNQNITPPGVPNGMVYPNNYQQVQKSPADGLITASLALGIAAIVSAILATVYFPFILGTLSIVMALLSKRSEEKMNSKSKAGITCAIVGLVLNVFVVGTSLYKIFTDEQTFNQFDRVYEQMYGQSFRDMYKDATGQDFPFDFEN